MKKFLLILLGTLIIQVVLTAQPAKNTGLSVEPADPGLAKEFAALQAAKEDTNKVDMLINLSRVHWKINYDSVVFYARQARTLSGKLKYPSGYEESGLMLAKSYPVLLQSARAFELLSTSTPDQQSRLLLVIGEYHLYLPELNKHDLDSAYLCFKRALDIALSIKSKRWEHEALIALGKYHFAADEFAKGKECFLKIIRDHRATGDKSAEAHIWSELGKYMPGSDATYSEELAANQMAIDMYYELKDTSNLVSSIQDIAEVYLLHSNYKKAIEHFQLMLQLRKAIGRKKQYRGYLGLALANHALGNIDEALYWGLESEKNARSLDPPEKFYLIPLTLALIYADNGQAQKSLDYFLSIENPDKYPYVIGNRAVEQFIALGQPQKALQYIREVEKKAAPKSPLDKELLAASKGDVYAALGNMPLAEKYYIEMIELDPAVQLQRAREIIPISFGLVGSGAYYKIARFYANLGRYGLARQYADRALQTNSFSGHNFYTSNLMRQIWWVKFQADSASGNYLAAIQHYEKYTALNDSIFSARKANEFQRLQVQYDTERKETEIKNRDEQIQVLTQNDLLRQSNLRQANTIRNITIGIAAIFLLLGAVLYRQYTQKKRSNVIISQKSEQLERLLHEKEWLLKEVHHRVKNNLHTVICLLESQAAYLQDDALKANEISQQRIYTMSLIHQKIYQSEDVKTIRMDDYLPELIGHLRESFGNQQRIEFEIDVDRIQLDIAQAIPVALIINEAVTNSIKYAFPNNRPGKIEVLMRKVGDEVNLTIADNGVGFDSSIQAQQLESLGLQLIRGLSKDIRAKLVLNTSIGTIIDISFQVDPWNSPELQSEGILDTPTYSLS